MRSPVRQSLAAVLGSLLLGGCLGACAERTADGPGPLVVRRHAGVLGRFTLPQLQGLAQVEISTPQSRGARVQRGPTVRSILAAAGTAGVDAVRVEGRDPAQTLTAAELTDQVILNITKRETLKLTGTQLSTDRWVRDVTTLVVNP